jgi:uncharacterized membrane protein required for colicin V production
MSIVIDLLIIGVIALFTFIGYKQGLIKSAIKILSFVIALIIALILYKPVSSLIINNTGLDDGIKNKIVESILPEGVSADEEVEIQNTLPNMIVESGRGTVNKAAESIAVQIIETGVLLVIFILVRFGLRFVTVLTDLITKLPVLKQFDELGGVLYGVFRGIVLVFVIFAVIYLFSPMMKPETVRNINKSFIGGTIYNNNILLKTLF